MYMAVPLPDIIFSNSFFLQNEMPHPKFVDLSRLNNLIQFGKNELLTEQLRLMEESWCNILTVLTPYNE